MRKKYYLSFILMLLTTVVLAQTKTVWNPAANPNSTGMWSEADNWTQGTVPDGSDWKVVFNVADAADCIVDGNAGFGQLVMGDNGPGGILKVLNGGNLQGALDDKWAAVGYNTEATLIVEEGAEANFANHLWIGMNNSAGTVIVDGGVLTVADNMGIRSDAGSSVVVKNGGSIVMRYTNQDKWNYTNALDIYEGTVSIGDLTDTDIPALIANGSIVAYGGNGEVVVEEINGKTVLSGKTPTKFPLDFEGSLYSFNNFDGGIMTTVDNPERTGINESELVGKMVKDGGQSSGGSWVMLDNPIDLTKGKAFKMKVYAPAVGTKVLLKLEHPSNSALSDEVEVETTVADTWEHLVFDMTGIIGSDEMYQKVVLIFDDGTTGDGSDDFTYFIDDIQQFEMPADGDGVVWEGDVSNLWSIDENWSQGFIPVSTNKVQIKGDVPEAVLNVSSTIGKIVLGDGGEPTVLRVADGGTLTTSAGWSGIGWNSPAKLIVETGGTVNFASHMWVGWNSDAVVELVGGTINVGEMYGTSFDDNYTKGSGTMNVRSGNLNLSQIHDTKSIPDDGASVINIEAGTVKITGDVVDIVTNYVSAEKIVGYSGFGTVVVDLVTDDGTYTSVTAAEPVADGSVKWKATVDNKWSNYANWDDGVVPDARKVQFADGKPECVMDVEATITQMVLGDGGEGENVLKVVDGGKLSTTNGWSGIGWTSYGKLIVETGAEVNFGSHMWVGFNNGAEGIVELAGGTINVAGNVGIDYEGKGGSGRIIVKEGELNLDQIQPINTTNNTASLRGDNVIDIEAGVVNIDGNYVDIVKDFIDSKNIVAYGGEGKVNVAFVDDITVTKITAVAPPVFKEIADAITIDGVADEAVWAGIEAIPMNQILDGAANVTSNDADLSATWKAAFDDNNIYVLVEVNDDINSPKDGESGWSWDRVELYFDANTENLKDGGGPGNTDGHYQPNIFISNDGFQNAADAAYKLDNGSYAVEFQLSRADLVDAYGRKIPLGTGFGFDVSVVDNDSGSATDGGDKSHYTRLGWRQNDNNQWSSMDDAGVAKLEGDAPEFLPALIMETTDAMTIDGSDSEGIWATVPQNPMFAHLNKDENPVTGQDDLSGAWKAVYDDDNIYVLVEVTDDIHSERFDKGGWSWDRVELYVDAVVDNLKDGKGPGTNYPEPNGHYQPNIFISEGADIGGFSSTDDAEATVNMGDGSYKVEFSISRDALVDQYGRPIPLSKEFGFDVSIVDNDTGVGTDSNKDEYTRLGWSYADGAWGNMDMAGRAILQGNHVAETPALIALSATVGVLTPDFSSEHYNYSVEIAAGEETELTAIPMNVYQTAEVSDFMDGVSKITVTNADDATQVYTVNLNEADPNVTFQVDFTEVMDLFESGDVKVNINGDAMYVMTDEDENEIYEYTIAIPAGEVVEYNFAYDTFDGTVTNVVTEMGGTECISTMGYRTHTVENMDTELPAVLFGKCEPAAEGILDITSFAGVIITGQFDDADWDATPKVPATHKNERAHFLNDDDYETKYLVRHDNGESWLEIDAFNSVVKSYTIASANDNVMYPDRDAKDWTLKGWDEANEEWVVIHEVVDNPKWGANFTPRSWDISDNETAYSKYRFYFTAVHDGGDMMQISEIELIGLPALEDVTEIPNTRIEATYDDVTWEGAGGPNASPDAENVTMLIDNLYSPGDAGVDWTKFLVKDDQYDNWVDITTNRLSVIRSYTFYSANDAPARDPRDWTLSGWDSENSTWVVIHTVTDNEPWTEADNPGIPRTWTVDNKLSFSKYRFNFTDINEDHQHLMQICEIELNGAIGREAVSGAVEAVEIVGPSTIEVGESIQFTAIITPTEATNTTVTWSVSDETKATIDPVTGILTGVATNPIGAAPVTVTATSNDNTEISVEKNILVVKSTAADLTDLTVDVGTLSPEFNTSTTEYTVEAAAGTTTVNITVTTKDDGATVTGDGAIDVSSGSAVATIVVTKGDISKTYTVDITVLSSIGDLDDANAAKLYYNRSTENVMINNASRVEVVDIFSVSGKLLKQITARNQETLEININELPAGVYIARMRMSSNTIQSTKFVK